MQYIFNACGKLALLKSSSIQLQNKKDGKKAVIFFKKGKEMEKHKGSEISDDGRKVISGR